MSERMGNGAIQISITVYPDLDGADKYNKSVTRAINIDHLGGLGEMFRISSSFGSTVVATIDAMLMTLAKREEQEAKAAAAPAPRIYSKGEALDGEGAEAEAEQPGDGDSIFAVVTEG